MTPLTPDDFKRLSAEVRRFLSKGGVMSRLAGMGTLYLEFPDVGTMHDMHRAIVNGMAGDLMAMSSSGQPWTFVDDHTIRIEPLAGVTIVLSCKQRFAVQSGGSVGYRDIAFKRIDPRDDT